MCYLTYCCNKLCDSHFTQLLILNYGTQIFISDVLPYLLLYHRAKFEGQEVTNKKGFILIGGSYK